ncbi:MAG: transposase [Lachnospiraceae bacterium]|nr:transposase [Lachnospiraceae bacterium]
MPRNARIYCESKIYHVMLRGINKQQIFYDEDDFDCFTDVLKKYKSVSGFTLYAYCLMGNHVHLLIGVGEEDIGTIFRRIGSSFVYRYNMKYERSGHLFQDRFRSEPVETDQYFMVVLRYILQNPVAAGLCSLPVEYKHSSAGEYLAGKYGITDTAYAKRLFGDGLETYLNAGNEDSCLDVNEKPVKRCTDSDAVRIIVDEFGTISPEARKTADKGALGRSILKIKNAGVSIRQLSRLTGLSKSLIERRLKELKS